MARTNCPISGRRPPRPQSVASSPLPSAQACPEKIGAQQGNYSGEAKRKRRQKKQQKKDATPTCYSSSAEAMREGIVRNSGCSSPPSSSAPRLRPSSLSLRSRRPHSDASLCASSSGWAGTCLPTSIVIGGKEAQNRLAAPRVGEEVLDLESVFATSRSSSELPPREAGPNFLSFFFIITRMRPES